MLDGASGSPSPYRRLPSRQMVRLVGWLLAVNAVGVLVAVTLGGTARDAVQRFALFCGLG